MGESRNVDELQIWRKIEPTKLIPFRLTWENGKKA